MPLDRTDLIDRLPQTYQLLADAVAAAGWDLRLSAAGPMRCGDVIREVVEVTATTRVGHRFRVWWVADAPPDAARPPFAPGGALVGQGYRVRDATVVEAVAYVRGHPVAHNL
ncbi:hypothetical protein ACQSSU_20355 [Micromonospora echinospora]